MLDLESIFFPSEASPTGMEVTVKEFTLAVPPSEYRDTVHLTRSAIEQAVLKFVTFLEEIGIRSIAAFELRLIVYEVLMNIKLHSGLKAEDAASFAVQIDRTGASFTFEDSGSPFDPSALGEPEIAQRAAESGRVRGFGLAMIHKMVEDVEYSREDNSLNKLKLTKMWS
jgi:anti-sigma regulatory factor (Ser/Thr protein kinase)